MAPQFAPPERGGEMTERTQFDAWITKYAMTSGILKKRVEDCFDVADTMVEVIGGRHEYYHGHDWHRTENEAIERANEMKRKKIASLEKQLKAIKALDFGDARKVK
jgi:hypothetical protein